MRFLLLLMLYLLHYNCWCVSRHDLFLYLCFFPTCVRSLPGLVTDWQTNYYWIILLRHEWYDSFSYTARWRLWGVSASNSGTRFKTHVFVLIHIWSAKRREAEKYMEKGNFWPVNEEGKGGNHLERENEWWRRPTDRQPGELIKSLP